MERDENLLKYAVIISYIANFCVVMVSIFNTTELLHFLSEMIMFFSSICITGYSLTPKTKPIIEDRERLVKWAFFLAASPILIMILSQINYHFWLSLLMILAKIITFSAGIYFTYLLLRIDREVSNRDIKENKKILEAVRKLDERKDSPSAYDKASKIETKKFVNENEKRRKGKWKQY